MPLYACRWPNGDLSLVLARNKADAIEQLDEFGNAEVAELFVLKTLLADFRLDRNGMPKLERFGELTWRGIEDRAYPLLSNLIFDPEWDKAHDDPVAQDRLIAKTVRREKKRLWDCQPTPPQARTEIGRTIQAILRMPSSLVDRIVDECNEEILEEYEGPVQ